MTKADPVPIIISIISLATAGLALLVSWRAQRAQQKSYKLQLQAAQQAGRLKTVEGFYKDKRKRVGLGFRVINGSNEVTVTHASVNITYAIIDSQAIVRREDRFIFDVGSDDFGVLGITGPKFDFRLEPLGQREWSLPYSASFSLPDITIGEDTGRKIFHQMIRFVFSVTASGATSNSLPLLFGSHEGNSILGYRSQTYVGDSVVESIILEAFLCPQALQVTSPENLRECFAADLREMAPELNEFTRAITACGSTGTCCPTWAREVARKRLGTNRQPQRGVQRKARPNAYQNSPSRF